MGLTATQKIILKHSDAKGATAGDIVVANVDLALANDITAPVAIDEINRLHGQICPKTRVVLVMDHFTPNKDIQSAEQCKKVRQFAFSHKIDDFFDVGKMGVEHALLPEQGFIKPSMLILGADSHTCTYGALGAFSTGVGSTDIAVAMAEGKCWLRLPSAIKVVLQGKLNRYVGGKDIILHLIGILGVDGATYKSLEFFGGGLANLTMDDRFTIANMAVECGAKNAFFPVDNITRKYLSKVGAEGYEEILPDDDAVYERVIELDLSKLGFTVSYPHLPSNTHTLPEKNKIKIDQVVIGSCTNGRLSDMAAAAEIFKGKKVAAGVRAIIIPATQQIYLECIKRGYTQIFIEAGAAVSTPTCGPCLGGHMGILADGERAVATTNRNFVGRMGHTGSEIYLASPAVAAASAIKGVISSPLEV